MDDISITLLGLKDDGTPDSIAYCDALERNPRRLADIMKFVIDRS